MRFLALLQSFIDQLPCILRLLGGLGFEAPYFPKAKTGSTPLGLSLPAFISLHSGKVVLQGPSLGGASHLVGDISRKGEGLTGWWMACF